ncbi:hypothetical protein AURDEDRAFT_65998 [Auricularia subglabra TFB-10046 SS5]|nr:hypothetical protein AURDEDRAFT_65998 [Auricularia subglabra TFB-10046 SS5]
MWNLFFSDFSLPDRDDDIRLAGRAVSHLEHADDVILMSTTVDGLVAHIDGLKRWALRSFVSINVEKTWALAAGAAPPQGVFIHSEGEHIPLSSTAKYVGMNLTSEDGRLFRGHYDAMAKRARKSLSQCFAVDSLTGALPVKMALKIYKARVDPHLISGADVSPDAVDAHVGPLEEVQILFLRRVMGLGSRSCVAPLFSETGIWPIRARRADMAIRYLEYCRARPDYAIVACALQDSIALDALGCESWFSDLRLALSKFDVNLPNGHFLADATVAGLRDAVRRSVLRMIHSEFASNEKLYLLRGLNRAGLHGRVDDVAIDLRAYLQVKRKRHRWALTGLLLSNHGLAVEQLRYGTRTRESVDRDDRLCRFCRTTVESELHALFECTACPNIDTPRLQLADEIRRLGIEEECCTVMRKDGFMGLIQYLIIDTDRASVLAAFVYSVLALFDATPLLRPTV